MPRRFTVVELMIVVAIVAILAAVAVPLLAQYQLKARLAEASPNCDALGNAAFAYAAADTTGAASFIWQPRNLTALDKDLVAWPSPNPWPGLEWAPDGAVRCIYSPTSVNGALSGGSVGTGTVYCNVDADTREYIENHTKGNAVSMNFIVRACKDMAGGGTDCTQGGTAGCVCY